MANEDRPLVTMDINQDPYQLLGQLGVSSGPGAVPKINISSIVGADLKRLELPQMLTVLRGVYERKGSKLEYRPLAFQVQTQAGTLSDIQAGMYRRFQQDQAEIDRLLDLLTPLIPDPDTDSFRSNLELTRELVGDIVDDAAQPGGPIAVKIKASFDKWVDIKDKLIADFGLDPDHVQTSDDAETWSRFELIDNSIASMQATYNNFSKYFDRTDNESFGNQVIWLARSLKAIKEAIVRLQFQLRARFVGMEELATKLILDVNITVAELLVWTAKVCDNGSVPPTTASREGMIALANDLGNLQEIYADDLTGAKVGIVEFDDQPIRQTIAEIVDAFDEAIQFADPDANSLRRRSAARKPLLPSTTTPALLIRKTLSFGPQSAKAGDKITITVSGDQLKQKKTKNWELVFTPRSGKKSKQSSITVRNKARFIDQNTVQFDVRIDAAAKPETYDLAIMTGGNPVWKFPTVFKVTK